MSENWRPRVPETVLAEDEIEAPRTDTDCVCHGDSCPCEADGPDGLCACCRSGQCNGSCGAPS